MDRQHVASWLRLHSAGERSFHRTLLEYFQDQGKRVGNALRDFDVITPSVVPLIFQPEDEAELLRPIVHRHMLAMMALGASDELVTASKAADDNFRKPSDFGLDNRLRSLRSNRIGERSKTRPGSV